MCGTASAASAVLTVMRTSSDPALARDFTCCTVPSMSAVSVFVIDCTTMGPAPPTRTGPMDTWTELRRWMDGMVCSEKGFLGPDILHGRMRAPHNRSVRRESGHRRNAEGASSARKRSGTRTADRRGSGEWWTPRRPPTEGERRRRRPISQVTGQRAAGGILCLCRSLLDSGAPVTRRTPLFDLHQKLGARIVDFGGWDMPLQYGSQIAEHHAVRRGAGVFDVSHMCVVDLRGARVRPFLQRLLANDVGKLKAPGKALYGCMLKETGGVIDDLIVYFLADSWFRAVVNAGTRDKDLAWMRQHAAQFGIRLTERTDLAMLAVQGPEARGKAASLLSSAGSTAALGLEPFFGREIDGWFVARTGYTGEDGFEIMLPGTEAERVWQALNSAGVTSCGLGARDTLRLEAGMNLYGNDMDESTHPFES